MEVRFILARHPALLLAATVALSTPIALAQAGDDIVIGASVPMTGVFAFAGVDGNAGVVDYVKFINDAGGSLVELDDEQTEKTLAANTLILYLKPDEEIERRLVQRAISDPKPLYYNEKFLDRKLAEYLSEAELESPGEIVPDDFVRWIFPALVAHRRPKYEALAARHGYTLSARLSEAITDERDFLDFIASVLD